MTQVHIGMTLPRELPPGEAIQLARRAESSGLDQVWIVEDCFYAGGIALTGAVLAATERIGVGLGILPAAVRNPAFTAMEIATLANLYPGRLVPGIGHGVPEWMRQVGAWPESPTGLLEETLHAVRTLLAGRTLTATGRYVRQDAVRLDQPPAEVPPVLAGVRGPRSLQLSGRSADGTVLAEPASAAFLRWAREQIEIGRRQKEGTAGPHQLVAYTWLQLDDDLDRARAVLRPAVGAALASGAVDAQTAPLGINDAVIALREAIGSTAEFVEQFPAEWIDQLAAVGPAATCAARIAELGTAGAGTVVLLSLPDQVQAQLDLVSRDLLPLLG